MSFSRWSEDTGSWDSSQEQRQRKQRARLDSQEDAYRGAPLSPWKLRSDHRMVRSLLFEGALNRFTSGQSLSGHKNRTGQGEGTEQRPWSPHRRGRSGRGAKSRTRQLWGVLEGTFPGPSCHRAGGSPAGDLSWVAEGRAAPDTRAPRSQPSASALQALPPAPHPVPVLPTGSPPSSSQLLPSEQLLVARPPTCLSWEKGSKNLEGFSRTGASGQLRVKQQSSQTPH